nr:RHS repeat-associated core domain-containing protein [Ramlibacter albus]
MCPANAVGNPINIATGNKYQQELDYADRSFVFARHYNSGLKAWTHSYSMRVWSYPASGTAVVVRPDGKTLVFTGTGSGEWQSNATVTERLFSVASPAGAAWKLVTGDDTVELYTSDGLPLELASRGNRRLRMQYAAGQLKAVVDDFGRQLQFAYDAQSRIAAITPPDAQPVRYEYNGNGFLAKASYADSTSRQYVYEDSRYKYALTGLVDETGTRLATWAYDDRSRAVKSEHAGGAMAHAISYDPSGLLVQVTNPLGAQRLLQRQSIGGKLLFAGGSAPCAGCSGDAAAKAFDARGSTIEHKDFAGVSTRYQYDARGLPVAIVRAAGQPGERTTAIQWHPTLSVPVGITEEGRTSSFIYDSAGSLLERTVVDTATGESRTWRWTYGNAGLVETAVDPKGRTWRIGYDSLGNRASITNPKGETTTYTHDAAGRVLSETRPNGLRTDYAYDLRGRLLRETRQGEATSYSYTPAGLLASVTLPTGYSVNYAYNAAQQLVGAADNRGASVVIGVDAAGNPVRHEVRDAGGNIAAATYRAFNSLGQLTAVQGAAGHATRFEHDANGELAAVVDPLNQRTQHALDALRRPAGTTLADGSTTSQTWGKLGQLAGVVDPKGVGTGFTYNAFLEVLSESSPDIGALKYTRDAAGDVVTSEDAKHQVTRYERDALGRPVLVRWHDGTTTSLSYDSLGKLAAHQDPSGSTTYTRDLQGRTLVMEQAVADNTASPSKYRVAYEYANGELATITFPSGMKVQYVRTLGRVTQINVAAGRSGPVPFVSNIGYTALGQPKQWLWSNGDNASRSFDADGRIIGNEFASYSYNALGQITGVTQHLWSQAGRAAPMRTAVTWSAAYDSRGRLTSFTRAGAGSTFEYDANGNRLASRETASGAVDLEGQFTTDAASQTVAQSLRVEASSNRLLGVTQQTTTVSGTSTSTVTASASFAPDENGAQTTDGLRTFVYDATGRMSKAEIIRGGEAASVIYLTNALGQRVFKSEPQVEQLAPSEKTLSRDFVSWLKTNFSWLFGKGGSRSLLGTAYVYNDARNLIGEYDNGTSTARGAVEYIYLPVEGGRPVLVGMYRGGVLYAIHTDQIGTPRVVTDPSKNPVWQWTYSAFGNNKPTGILSASSAALKATPPAVELNKRFDGQYYDAETGLFYNDQRTYCPGCGRFMQPDPLGLHAGWNRITYVGGNPLSFIDPFGLRTGVTIWQPVGWGESSFGHVSVDINGTTFSFGPGGMTKMPTSEYTSKNDFRSGTELELPLTPQQEAALQQCLSRPQGDYNVASNNCGSPVQRCLSALGVNTGNQTLPASLGNKLIEMGLVKGIKEYPQSKPSTGTSAPWAR